MLLVLGAPQARAGMFDDRDEARRQIKDLSIQVNERLDAVSKAQFELVNRIRRCARKTLRLRGQVGKRLSTSLIRPKNASRLHRSDDRLRKLEPQAAAAPEGGTAPAGRGSGRRPLTPAAESRGREAALNFFKANKVKGRSGRARILRQEPTRTAPSHPMPVLAG